MKRRLPKDVLRGVPIVGVTGVNGAGKTTLAVQSVIHDLLAGRRVFSTVPVTVVHPRTGELLSSEPVTSLRQLLELRDCTLLLDDVAVIFSSRSTSSLPPEIVALLDTTRHRGLRIVWTAPAWSRCDNLLRGVTQAVLNVVPLPLREHNETPWPRPRFIAATLLDTSAGKLDEMPTRVVRRAFYRQKGLAAFGAYDTHADTPLLGRHQNVAGVCPDCGGSRVRPKHSPERHAALGIPFFDDLDQEALPRASDAPAVAFDTLPEMEQPPA